MYTASSWELPPELAERQAERTKPKWYEDTHAADGLEARLNAEWQAIKAADTKPWNPSPLKTEFGIQSGRALNLAFIVASVLAAPAAVAFGPFITASCCVLAAAYGIRRYYVKDEQEIQAMLGASELAPPAVHILAQQAFARAGLPTDTFNTLILHSNERNKNHWLLRQLPYTAAATSRTKTPCVMIGKRTLETLTQAELFAIMCHEASHIKNDKVPTRSALETTASALPAVFMAASILSLNITAVGYYFGVSALGKLGGKYLKRIDEYRADRNSVGLARDPEATISGTTKITDLLLGELLAVPPEKVAKVKKRRNKLELLNEYPADYKRAAYIRSVGASLNI